MSTTSSIASEASAAPHRAARSRRPAAAAALAAILALGGCLPGPWDYYPEDPPVFRGIWMNAYAMAGKPIAQVCMERFVDIDEEYTDAFPFYDSASVRITGRFGDSAGGSAVATLELARLPDAPNCFAGDPQALVLPGQNYDMAARVTWDSVGTTVTHVLTATARVPAEFSIRDSAVAPKFAVEGGLAGNVFSVQFYLALPEEVQNDPLVKRIYDGIRVLLEAPERDTTAILEYVRTNGPALQARLGELLEPYQEVYREGDTVAYLGVPLNTLSHYFTSDRSPDVAGVLITHRFDSTDRRPETAFQDFLGLKSDSSEFYFEGSVRRLGLYPAATAPDGYDLLDSIGVVNTWYHAGSNRLYFYGMEDAYLDYGKTAIENGENPRAKPKTNISGGMGFFAGGVPDSFDLFIEVDTTSIKAYSLPATHAFQCRKEGWYSNKDCSTYYRPYCLEVGWEPKDCGVDAVNASLKARLGDSTLLGAAPAAARADAEAVRLGTDRFCVENDFPDLDGVCDAPREACGRPGTNGCKEALWSFCKDNLWRPDQCGEGLAWYCRDKDRPSEVMCRHADAFCRDNPGNAACR